MAQHQADVDRLISNSPVTLLRANLRNFLDYYLFYLDFCRPSFLNDIDGA